MLKEVFSNYIAIFKTETDFLHSLKSRLDLVNKPIQEGFFTKHNTFRFEMKQHKLLGPLIVVVFLASTVTAAAQMYPKALNPTVYGETTIYEFNGNPTNLTATIDSLETRNNQTEVAFTLTLMSPTFDVRGEEMNASQYHKPEETSALQYYLRSALTFDLDRNFTINAVWVNWLGGSGEDIESGYTTLDAYSHYFSLNQSGNSFHGNAVLPKLSEGVHNVTFWVTARQNYISYFIPLWAVFSKTVTFTMDNTASPSPSPTLSKTLTPSPSIPEFQSCIILSILSIAGATAGLLVYHKKHNR